jgi:hypothetical protein
MKAKQKRTRASQVMIDRSAAFLIEHSDEDLTVADVSCGIRWEPEVEGKAFARAKLTVLSGMLRRARVIDEATGKNTTTPRFGRYYVWFQKRNGTERKVWCIREWHLMDREQMRKALEQRDTQWKRGKTQMECAADYCNMLLRRWKQKPLKYGEYEWDGDSEGSLA